MVDSGTNPPSLPQDTAVGVLTRHFANRVIVCCNEPGPSGNQGYNWRRCRIFSLPKLLLHLAHDYTSKEIYEEYKRLRTFCLKRPHSKALAARRKPESETIVLPSHDPPAEWFRAYAQEALGADFLAAVGASGAALGASGAAVGVKGRGDNGKGKGGKSKAWPKPSPPRLYHDSGKGKSYDGGAGQTKSKGKGKSYGKSKTGDWYAPADWSRWY